MACLLAYIYLKLKQILFVESLRPIGHCLSQLVQRFANYFDLLWYVFLVGMCRGGGYFWKFQFLWVLKNFLPPCTFCRCLVCLQTSKRTSCYEHRHGLTQTCRRNDQICHRGGISQKHKSRLYCDVPPRKKERCGCKWGDEVGMNDIPFTISRGGAHCGVGNREAGCKLFKLPVYRAFLPDTLPHTPVLHIELQNSLKCCFPKRLGPNMKYKVYNFHPRRGTYKIDHRSQINILRT